MLDEDEVIFCWGRGIFQRPPADTYPCLSWQSPETCPQPSVGMELSARPSEKNATMAMMSMVTAVTAPVWRRFSVRITGRVLTAMFVLRDVSRCPVAIPKQK